MDKNGQVTLEDIFTVPKLKRAWKESVREGMRSQVLQDLHDYMDFHLFLDERCDELAHDVLRGSYRPGAAHLVAVEKGQGICRRLWLPHPRDAVALQAIVNAIEPQVKDAQPSPRAFYSRSHVHGPLPEQFQSTFGYPWWALWPKFQREILGFIKTFPFVISTDLLNYFDSVPLSRLRESVAAIARVDDSTLALLFMILESFTVRVSYSIHPGVGLPVLDFDAPRILAHLYLFPLDRYLDAQTKGNFVRWVDDIDFGAATRQEALAVIRGLDDLLYVRGLRLNLAKTDVRTAKEGALHFWVGENARLSTVSNLIDTVLSSGLSTSHVKRYFRTSYAKFRRKRKIGHWDKVAKRYINLGAKIGDEMLLSDVWRYLTQSPGLRDTCFRYLQQVGYTTNSLRKLLLFMSSVALVDDASVFGAARVIVAWRIPLDPAPHRLIRRWIRGSLQLITSPNPGPAAGRGDGLVTSSSSADRVETKIGSGLFLAALWLALKFGTPSLLWSTIVAGQQRWESSEFLARQVAAAVPRVWGLSGQRPRYIKDRFVRRGLREALAVLDHIALLRQSTTLSAQLHSYLARGSSTGADYPLSKILIATDVLMSQIPHSRKVELSRKLMAIIQDDIYRTFVKNALHGRHLHETARHPLPAPVS